MSVSEIQPPESYTQEDVQEILQLAIANKTDLGELTRAQLWEIASELDIDNDSLKAAEQDWLNRKTLNLKRLEFNRYRREKLKQKAVRYTIINFFLIALNLLSAGTLTWSIYLFLLMGLPLSLATWKTFQTQGDAYEEAFQRWHVKNEMKQSIFSLWNKLKRAFIS